MITRRKIVIALGAGALAPIASFAQQPTKVWRIGYLGNTPLHTSPELDKIWAAFERALQDRGYVAGRNVVFEMRFAQGKLDRLPALAAELVQLKVDVIVLVGNPAAQVAKKATATIPIVVIFASDPAGVGLIASLGHPGGNITGIADYSLSLIPKRLELLKATVPAASRVAYIRCFKCAALDDAANLAVLMGDRAAAAKRLGMTLADVDLSGPQDLENATAAVLRAQPDAVFLGPNPITGLLGKKLVDFAIAHRLPLSGFSRDQTVAGGLMSYGTNFTDAFLKSADFVDRILKGAKPGDLPFEDPTKFELVINLKTAKALGIKIPQSIMVSADEVIE